MQEGVGQVKVWKGTTELSYDVDEPILTINERAIQEWGLYPDLYNRYALVKGSSNKAQESYVNADPRDPNIMVVYTDLDGELVSVVRRLAGTNAEGQTYEGIQPEADGSYVLKDLKLSENEDFSFDLRLEGTQYLENGVYVYSPVGGRDASQAG